MAERRVAPAPFNDPDADVVIRSSEGVDFHVFKFYLLRASPVFHGMFTIPQPKTPDTASTKGGLPVVSVTEDEMTLVDLFSLCYGGGGEFPLLEDLDRIKGVIEAARKYGVRSAAMYARTMLSECASENPVRVYAIASLYGFKDLAKKAAQASLHLPYEQFRRARPPELEQITGAAFQSLVQYRLDSQEAMAAFILDTKRIPRGFFASQCVAQSGCIKTRSYAPGVWGRMQPWMKEYLSEAAEAIRNIAWEGVLTKENALVAFLNSPSECSNCRRVADKELSQFIADVQVALRGQQAKIILNLDHIIDTN